MQTTAWRMFIAYRGFLYSPEATAGQRQVMRWTEHDVAAKCHHDPTHRPPVKSCGCGVHAVLDGWSLLRYIRHCPEPLERRVTLAIARVTLHGDLLADRAQNTFRGSVRAGRLTLKGPVYVDERWWGDDQSGPQGIADYYGVEVVAQPSLAWTLKLPKARAHPLLVDNWVPCVRCSGQHWGRHGAAGLLLLNKPGTAVLLQRRSHGVQHPYTWSIPGGAREDGETARDCALRESQEESAVPADAVTVTGEYVDDGHGKGWTYTTVLARATRRIVARSADRESTETRWVPLRDVDTLPLHPAFAAAWPHLRELIRAT